MRATAAFLRREEAIARAIVVTDYLKGKDVPEFLVLAACRRFSNRMFKRSKGKRKLAYKKHRAKNPHRGRSTYFAAS